MSCPLQPQHLSLLVSASSDPIYLHHPICDVLSSANFATTLLTSSYRSFMNKLKSTGPNPPCEILLLTSFNCKNCPFFPTICFLSFNQFLIHKRHILLSCSIIPQSLVRYLVKSFLKIQSLLKIQLYNDSQVTIIYIFIHSSNKLYKRMVRQEFPFRSHVSFPSAECVSYVITISTNLPQTDISLIAL